MTSTTQSEGSATRSEAADQTARRQQALQREQDRKDESAAGSSKSESDRPMQAGAREQPANMPAQHIIKPGHEHELQLQPRFDAPDYRGSGKLQDKVALITGGDSGIGRAVAVLFAREGADVAIVYLSEHEDADDTRAHVEREGRRCITIAGDVRDAAFCSGAVEQTVRELGKLDILINNAAFQEHAEQLTDLSEERFDETMRTNVYGYFHMAKAALAHLHEGASIINTGSTTGLKGSSNLLDYSMSKGAIHAFTKALAHNLIDKGVRVNAVAPGPVWTPFNPADKAAEQVAEFGKSADMKRAAQPEEISPAYVFLAAPVCSGYITGIVLPVTGSVDAI